MNELCSKHIWLSKFYAMKVIMHLHYKRQKEKKMMMTKANKCTHTHNNTNNKNIHMIPKCSKHTTHKHTSHIHKQIQTAGCVFAHVHACGVWVYVLVWGVGVKFRVDLVI